MGIDEVGRGPWAGPLVVGAVVLGADEIEGLTDSKKLTSKKRQELAEQIHKSDASVGLGWIHPAELDELGLSQALVEATKRAVAQISVPYTEIIIDGTINFLKETGKGRYVTTLAKADLLIPAVSAASIVAKVARDKYMEEQATLYPKYGFDSHVGYGTAKHQLALAQYGPTPLHRQSFAPVKKMLPQTKQDGNKAEKKVADYLQGNGHTILERNWRTKYCEIDIISEYEGILYFTEVKYRSSYNQGGGSATITPRKEKHLAFSAELYLASHPTYQQAVIQMVSVGARGALELFQLG